LGDCVRRLLRRPPHTPLLLLAMTAMKTRDLNDATAMKTRDLNDATAMKTRDLNDATAMKAHDLKPQTFLNPGLLATRTLPSLSL